MKLKFFRGKNPFQTRIVGGVEATPNEYICTAVLLDNNYQLTHRLFGGGTISKLFVQSLTYPSELFRIYITYWYDFFIIWIVSSNAILTTAHTVLENNRLRDPSTYKVHIGRHNIARRNIKCMFIIWTNRFKIHNFINSFSAEWGDTIYSSGIEIAGYAIHPNFTYGDTDSPESDLNDIAIIFLKQYIPLSAGTGPCCLPNPGRE